jgi:transcriptional regulator with XRE-family HTH domain
MVLSIHHTRYEKLRKHLKALRLLAGLTQKTIAPKLQQEQSYISKIERGERYVDMLFYLDWCRACNITPSDAIKILEELGV